MTPRRTGRPWRRTRAAILATSNICHLCGQPINLQLTGLHPDGPTIDHTTPLANGGTNHHDNLAPAHRACNLRKGAGQPRRSQPW